MITTLRWAEGVNKLLRPARKEVGIFPPLRADGDLPAVRRGRRAMALSAANGVRAPRSVKLGNPRLLADSPDQACQPRSRGEVREGDGAVDEPSPVIAEVRAAGGR
jgi:hypothetical protein